MSEALECEVDWCGKPMGRTVAHNAWMLAPPLGLKPGRAFCSPEHVARFALAAAEQLHPSPAVSS